MNIWTVLLLTFWCTVSSGSEIKMETNKCIVTSTHRSLYEENGLQFTGFMVCTMPIEVENNTHGKNYKHDDLLRVCESAKQDKRYKVIDFNAVNTIRLNRWGKWDGRTTKPQCRNPSNLIYIKPTNKMSNLTEHNIDQSMKITLTSFNQLQARSYYCMTISFTIKQIYVWWQKHGFKIGTMMRSGEMWQI